MQVEG
jgi:hypothetical protein